MRNITALAALAAVLVSASSAVAAGKTPAGSVQVAAISAQQYGVKAYDNGLSFEVGYSAKVRRAADCLASFPGYNPKTDLIYVRAGVVKRCTL